ncbi:hypothetical protein [Sediminitomix flava]|uniref:Uncharacterized protein n=1 Tax=Sediminitomix flava TaxID=379075 RepID=A0A315YW75_SEDFL|nr:hypothetical protein [Sediminitomix flava]PWJ33247.1 hypothetical protein BC781_1149 [Sediminitomix flava]
MIKKILLLIIGFFISGCGNKKPIASKAIPKMMQVDLTGVDIDDFPVGFGQVLQFENGNDSLKAVVLDFSDEIEDKWVGVCFINQNKLFGRQIPSGLINTQCLDLLDLTYIHTQAFTNFKVLETITVDKTKVGVGSRSVVKTFSDIKSNFDWGIEQRLKEQTPFNQGLTDPNAIRECYFEIAKIKK